MSLPSAWLESVFAWSERHASRVLVALVCVELAAGLVYSIHLGPGTRYWDEAEYLQIARGLVDQGEFRFGSMRAFRPPGYPWLLSALLAVRLPVPALRMVNFACLAVTMWLTSRIVKRTARVGAGLLAAAWVLAYPVFFYAAGTLYPQTLAATLVALFVWLVTAARRDPAAAILPGLVFGALVLTVPSFAPLFGLFLIWLLVYEPHAWRYAGIALLAMLAPIAAWSLRTHAVLHHWVFVATNSGYNFLIGNNPGTLPGSGVNVDISAYLRAAPAADEVIQDRFYRDAAWAWIHAHPGDALRLYVGKLIHYFATSEQLATSGESSRARTFVLSITYLPVLAGVALRCVMGLRHRPGRIEVLLLGFYLVNAFLAAAFFTRVRFRLPMDVLGICVVATLVGLAGWRRTTPATDELVAK